MSTAAGTTTTAVERIDGSGGRGVDYRERGSSIAIRVKSTTDGYEDASQQREMRSERKIRKLRAELEETVQARKKELAKESEARKTKGRGAGGAAGVAEEESCRRGNSVEDSSGRHKGEESPGKSTGAQN